MAQWQLNSPMSPAMQPTSPESYMDEDEYLAMLLRTAPPRRSQQDDHHRRASGSSRLANKPYETTELTTLMFRNIPNRWPRDRFLELLDQHGFRGCYDFAYVPTDFHRNGGLGYAFVNFVCHADAEKAMQHFTGFSEWEITTRKVCEVSWSCALQGLSAHIERYRDSPVMHESVPECFKPVFLESGVRQPFPSPTKRIRPPRVKRGKMCILQE